jgi:DNA repair exonuclease SbcCD ATPase subunit
MTEKATDCGSPSCLLEGLKEAIDKQSDSLKEQHQESREFMKELMMTHVGQLKEELAKTNATLDKHTALLYPMIREIGGRVTKLEAVAVDMQSVEKKIEAAIADAAVEAKIEKTLRENNDLVWVRQSRKFASAIFVIVAAAMILEGANIFLKFYDRYNLSSAASITAPARK